MTNEIIAEWKNNMSFEAEIDGHKLIVDASNDVGGENKGPRPKKLLLMALAGCTGMDVISILKKMKVEVSKFNVKVIGNASDEHPKKYTEMKIIYQFKGNNLELEKLKKAVDLSLNKYCSVNAVLKETIKIDFDIEIID
jgi:putative redox protein